MFIDKNLNLSKICDFKFENNPKTEVFQKPNLHLLLHDLRSQNFPYLIQGLNSKYPILNFIFAYDGETNHAFFNIESSELLTVKNSRFINDIAIITTPIFRGSFSNGFLATISASKFMRQIEEAGVYTGNQEMYISEDMRIQLLKVYETTTTNDNHLIIFYYLK
ncbi:MAG: hypothetical protein U9N86_11670 [Bacteroidota bacterium]|nr:hypothetical protein [Bacteroidota bacterium]